jgi:hypothetical protein
MNLGDGADAVNVVFGDIEHFPLPDLLVNFGAGNDTFMLSAGDPSNPAGATAATHLWHVNVNDAGGNDMTQTQVTGPIPLSEMVTHNGSGIDSDIYQFADPQHNMPVPPEEYAVHAGMGGDDIRVSYDFHDVTERPTPELMPLSTISLDLQQCLQPSHVQLDVPHMEPTETRVMFGNEDGSVMANYGTAPGASDAVVTSPGSSGAQSAEVGPPSPGPVQLGVNHLAVTGRDGNDDVTIHALGGPDTVPPDVYVNLGNGQDTIDLAADFSMLTLPTLGTYHARFQTKNGNDQVHAQFVGSAAINLSADLGDGNNNVGVELAGIAHLVVPDAVFIHLGKGNNNVDCTNTVIPEKKQAGAHEAPLYVTITAQGGNNQITNEWLFGAYATSPGDLPTSYFPLNTYIRLGQGNNQVQVVYGFNPQYDLTGFQGLCISAPIHVNVKGGAGGDNMGVAFFNDATANPPPPVILNSLFDVNLQSGTLGSDMGLDFGSGDPNGITPVMMGTGNVRLNLAGGPGDDVIHADMFFGDTQGKLNAIMSGGAGDDDLAFHIHGISDALVHALVDGGAGYDAADVTANVKTKNCEVVMQSS